jgi:hypothetical protein
MVAMGDITNCPNCGAVIHDCVCEYCGTVFPTAPDGFYGKRCMLVAIDDDGGGMYAMALHVNSMERSRHVCFFNTDTYPYIFDRGREVTIVGTIGDAPTLGHIMNAIRKRLESTWGNQQ